MHAHTHEEKEGERETKTSIYTYHALLNVHSCRMLVIVVMIYCYSICLAVAHYLQALLLQILTA